MLVLLFERKNMAGNIALILFKVFTIVDFFMKNLFSGISNIGSVFDMPIDLQIIV